MTRLFGLTDRPLTRLLPLLDPTIWNDLIKGLLFYESFEQFIRSATCDEFDSEDIQDKAEILSRHIAELFPLYLDAIRHQTPNALTSNVLKWCEWTIAILS